jgi:hypothetical protein
MKIVHRDIVYQMGPMSVAVRFINILEDSDKSIAMLAYTGCLKTWDQLTLVKNSIYCEISGSHGGQYEE